MGRDNRVKPLSEFESITQKNPTPSELDLRDTRRIQVLINLYQRQLVKGCGNPNCNTPTCRTYRFNNSRRPPRSLSLASARATAFFLVDTETPESNLCPHIAQNVLQQFPKENASAEASASGSGPSEGLQGLQKSIHPSNDVDLKGDSTRRDPNSFSQRLFGTASVEQFLTIPVTKCASESSAIQTGRRELVEAERSLSIAMALFRRRKDATVVAAAVADATATLRKFFILSMNLILGRDVAYPSSLFDVALQGAENPSINDILKYPDPAAVRLATRVSKLLVYLVSQPSYKSNLKDVMSNESPLDAKEHGVTLILKLLFMEEDSDFLGLWMEPVFLKTWNEDPIIKVASPAGVSLFVWALLKVKDTGGWKPTWRLKISDPMNAAVTWMRYSQKSGRYHILEFPWIIARQSQVECFRALCFYRMSDAVDQARLNMRLLYNSFSSLIHDGRPPTQGPSLQSGRLQMAMSRYLTLQVYRESILSDALDELWGRQQRELFRPLRVKILDAGEVGLDQGGLAQEFIRLVWIEAFKPDYGLFTVDSRTRMSWFDPKSLEPVYKYELLGLIMALAIFNGLTLPVTFPLALYAKLCKEPATFEELKDGWPDLAEGLLQLLKWEDGDVSDVFLRSYTFTFEAYGEMVHIDMTKYTSNTPFSTLEAMANSRKNEDNAPLVTNATRARYVYEYQYWLREKSIEDQYRAFAKGFYTIIDENMLRTITPEVLREVTEGQQHIDTKTLERVTRYDAGFCWHRPYIKDFWAIVHSYDDEQKKRLLEFVTASDRVPVTGMESVDFIVQRHGGDTESLPTSVTCFSRLLLPEYASKEKLRQKLNIALENSQGFGLS